MRDLDRERSVIAASELELLPYSLRSAYQTLNVLDAYQRRLAEAYSEIPPGRLRVLTLDERDSMAFSVDAYFLCARRAQNAITRVLARVPRRQSLSPSLNDLYEGIAKSKRSFGKDIDSTIVNYWERSGRRLKDYRDLLEHYALPWSDCRLFAAEGGGVGIFFALPNNPMERSPARLSYEPQVDALPYMIDSFLDLISFCNEVVDTLIEQLRLSEAEDPVGELRSTMIVFRTPLRIGPGADPVTGHRLPLEVKPSVVVAEHMLKHVGREWVFRAGPPGKA